MSAIKVIDLGLGLPPDRHEIASRLKTYFLDTEAGGEGNYGRIFGPKLLESLGSSIEQIQAQKRQVSSEEFASYLDGLSTKPSVSLDTYLSELDAARIEWGMVFPHLDDNEGCATSIRKAGGRLKGIAGIDPSRGDDAVAALRRAINDLEFIAYYASPFDWRIRADNASFYPLYEEACALDIPVFIYTSMNYDTSLPMDLGRPLYLDQVARDFPSMRIVAECGGWPWVPEMVGLARRHPNVYINTCSHRPKYLAAQGSGWEMLMRFGNSLLQDRIVFASGASDMGLSVEQVVSEMLNLPLKDKVKEKWLYTNAVRLFDA